MQSNPNFESAIEYVLSNEGLFVDNKDDAGGPTNMGITLKDLQRFRKIPVTRDDLIELTKDEAKQLYYEFFWHPLYLDSLPVKIATAIFDMSINQGPYSAIRLAQRACQVADDGNLGPKTIMALQDINPQLFIENYVDAIQDKYCDICLNLPTQLQFLKGWLRRSRKMFRL